MSEDDDPQGLAGQVSCAYCGKTVPPAEAYQPEGEEYAMYFCGLDCYRRWREKAQKEVKD